jgi:hypothetical protein
MITRDELQRHYEGTLASVVGAVEAERGAGRAAAFARLVSEIAARVLPGASFSRAGAASVGGAVQASGLFGEGAVNCDCVAGLIGARQPAGLVFGEIRLYDVKEWYDPKQDLSPESNTSKAPNQSKEIDAFHGVFFSFERGSRVRGTTFLEPPRRGSGFASREALDDVPFPDDDAFSRAFRVTASDTDEAIELLLPSTRSGLLGLREIANAPVHVSVSERRISVAIESDARLLDPGPAPTFDRIARIADLLSLPDAAAAAFPAGVARHGDVDAPSRPATSRTKITRAPGGMRVLYTRAVRFWPLALSALATPLLAWFWLIVASLAFSSESDGGGAAAAAIPLAVATLVWLFFAQGWWAPVRVIEIDRAELRVTHGMVRRRRIPRSELGPLEIRKGVLHAGDIAISPELPGAELDWLAYEFGRTLRS